MRVITYKACSEETEEKYVNQIEKVIPNDEYEVYTDIANYGRALNIPFTQHLITILLIENSNTLSEIIEQGLLDNITNSILIIPKDNTLAVSLGYRLHPRFVAYIEESFDKVAVVLMNMMINILHGEKGRENIIN